MEPTREELALDILDALDYASQSVFYVIQDGCFVYGNQNGCRFTGLSQQKDVLGKPALTFVHPEDKAFLTEMSRKAMQGEIIRPFEWRLYSVDDRIVWVMGLLMRIMFKGRPALLGSYIDITDTKQTGWELKQTYKKLEEVTLDLESAREEERAQIAWELQENLGETLISLKKELLKRDGASSKTGQSQDILIHRVDAALDTTIRISGYLKPATVDLPVESTSERFIRDRDVRILLGCGQPILGEGIQRLLLDLPEIAITRQAITLHELMEQAGKPEFDMVLIETSMLGAQAIEGFQKVRKASSLPVLVFHAIGDDDDLAVRMLRQGAAGYLSCSSSTNELLSAIHKVAGGRKHINNRIAEKLAFEVDVYSPKPFHHKLSDRERQVMIMIAKGWTMKEIAAELALSYKTIATYRSRIFEKMKVRKDAEIVRYAVSKGLI